MRRTLLQFHRYLGIVLAAFLVVAGITGSILAFYYEFDAWLNPALFRIEQAGQASQSPSRLVAAVASYDDRIRVYYLPVVSHPKRASVVYVEALTDPRTGRPYDIPIDEVFIDPVTAEVKGARLWGECCGRENWIPMVHILHNRMFLPSSIGRPVWGGIAILWTLMAVAGLLLSLPETRPFLRRWKAAWQLKRGLSFAQMNFQLHRATGLWFWLLILPVAVSGIALGLEDQVFRPVMAVLSPLSETAWDQADKPAASGEAGHVSFDEAMAQAAHRIQSLHLDAEPLDMSYSAEKKLYRVGFGRPGKPGVELGDVFVDARSGAIRGELLAGGRSFGDAANAAKESLHSGRIAGLPGRILIFLCGWAVALLSITGVILWWKRRRRPDVDQRK